MPLRMHLLYFLGEVWAATRTFAPGATRGGVAGKLFPPTNRAGRSSFFFVAAKLNTAGAKSLARI